MSDIYLNIKSIIKKKKFLTQKDIADTVGVSKTTFSNWMTKKVGITAEQIPVIAKALHVSISELYGEQINLLEQPTVRTNQDPHEKYATVTEPCNSCADKERIIKAQEQHIEDLRRQVAAFNQSGSARTG